MQSQRTVKAINAAGLHYRELNQKVKQAVNDGEQEIVLHNVRGQRYLGTGVGKHVAIVVNGVPGNDLGAFMDGPTIRVNGNAQDGVANTMNSGKIVVKGHAGDVLGYGMRGGKLFVAGDVGYRVGIHMKAYKDQVPVIVVGGRAGDFFGEYAAGGVLILLGLPSRAQTGNGVRGGGNGRSPASGAGRGVAGVSGKAGPCLLPGPGTADSIVGDHCGAGMHGGVVYLRGEVDSNCLGKEVRQFELDSGDRAVLESQLSEFCTDTGHSYEEVMSGGFVKLLPTSHRPYGRLYTY